MVLDGTGDLDGAVAVGAGLLVGCEGVDVDDGNWVVTVGTGARVDGGAFVVGADSVTDTVGAAACCVS